MLCTVGFDPPLFYGRLTALYFLLEKTDNKVVRGHQMKTENGYAIRYTDGYYNGGDGWPVPRQEATVYESKEEAEKIATDLLDVARIEPFENCDPVWVLTKILENTEHLSGSPRGRAEAIINHELFKDVYSSLTTSWDV